MFGKIGLSGAINMKNGKGYSLIGNKFNADTFLDFIKGLVSYIPKGKTFVIILHNARLHHSNQ